MENKTWEVLQQYSRASPMPRKPTGTFLRPESMMMSEDRHSSYFYGVKCSSDNCILQFNKTFPEMEPNVRCPGSSPYDWNHERICFICTVCLWKGWVSPKDFWSHLSQQLGIQTWCQGISTTHSVTSAHNTNGVRVRQAAVVTPG